mgnify:CR=1 FL=1
MGSEMCIRDRLLAMNPSAVALYHDHGIDLTSEPLQIAVCAQHNNCLLYTSDAADERSSVDLGGRRIIKKKKRNTITGLRH